MCMAPAAELGGDDPADLLPLALSRPNEALDRARKVLADDPGLLEASIARQTIGIVLREYGDIDAAIGELRIARRTARPTCSRRSGSRWSSRAGPCRGATPWTRRSGSQRGSCAAGRCCVAAAHCCSSATTVRRWRT